MSKFPMNEDKVLQERKEKLLKFAKQKYLWISYIILGILVWLAWYIRTLGTKINYTGLPGLWDVTTNNWTLGPDLDPFLFLRWAKYIVENGHLMAVDMMRNVPLGISTRIDFVAHSYFIAWFHDILAAFGLTSSVEYSAVLYPVFIFCLGIIFVFLFVRKIFEEKLGKIPANLIGLISAFFTTIIPVLLPRTIAGIPDKQGTFVFFLFFSLYLFISAWKAKTLRNQLILGFAAGIATGIFYIVWGGGFLTSIVVAPSVFIMFLIGKVDKNKTYTYLAWLIVPPFFLLYFSARYTVMTLLMSIYTGFPIVVGLLLVFYIWVYIPYLSRKISFLPKLPDRVKSAGLVIILMILIATIIFGPGYVFRMITTILSLLISPAPTDRFNLTVAQNRVPYFSELADSFGPYFGSIPIFFTIFLFGAVYLLYKMLWSLENKQRWTITLSYAFMLFAILASKYSANSILNGESFQSHALYALGLIAFIGSVIYFAWKNYESGNHQALEKIDSGYIILSMLFFLTLISVKGAVRLVLLLVPPASILASFFVVALFVGRKDFSEKSLRTAKIILGIIVALCLIYAGNTFYQSSVITAENYVPNLYTHQWQFAMSWVRDNTPQNAVFGHWWDYGYWLQSIGNRSTVLDGGNVYTYWDHLMGRYALTGNNSREALDFLYSHNTTHFLIDSTDIGKYAAYASIGSDINYDRYSWINTLIMNPQQTQERKNSTLFVFSGGSQIDDDIIYYDNGTKEFLPKSKTYLAGITLEYSNLGVYGQPIAIFVDSTQTKQYNIPLKYFYENNTLHSFTSGLDAGIYLMPIVAQQGNQVQFEQNGAILYLSPRTVHSQMVRLYLFKDNDPNFILVHSEDDPLLSLLKAQNATNVDLVYDQTSYANARGGNIAGPIRIWEIKYPAGISVNQTYLQTDYPDQALTKSR